MSSLLTNMSAMSAVASLTATQKALATTQSEISTGLKVGSAQDNASYWSIATSMRSDIGALGAVSDSINLGTSVVSTAAQAVSSSIGILNQMKDLVVTAQTAGQDTSTIDTQMLQLQDQLRAFSNSATFNGVNLLATANTAAVNPQSVVTSFSKSGTTDTVGTTNISLINGLYSVAGQPQSTIGTGILDKPAGTAGTGDPTDSGYSIDNMQTNVVTTGSTNKATMLANEQNELEKAISGLTKVASTLGSIQSNLTAQSTFTQTLSDSLTSGVGSLVDANMNQASTRLNALQTQQQLGIQSLSIANSNSNLILKLFQ
jgi:flagellin